MAALAARRLELVSRPAVLMAMPAPRLVHSDSWLDVIAHDYERALQRENLSPATVRIYLAALKQFSAFLREQGIEDLHQLDRDLVERWQDSLRQRVPPLKSSSRSLYGTATRLLLRWAAEKGIVDWRLEKAVVGTRTRHSLPRPIPPDDLALIKSVLAPRRARMTVVELRDRAMFHYFLTSGARVSEALQVRKRDFERPIVIQKGGTEKELRIPATVVTMVHDYLSVRRDDLPWLWLAHGNNVNAVHRLEASGVREAWRRLCIQLRIDRFTTHQLRHTCATELLERGVSELAIMEHLGHHNLQTLHVYSQVRDKQRKHVEDVMEQLVQPGRPTMLPKTGRRGYGAR
jgi:integrase/recombinase XerD